MRDQGYEPAEWRKRRGQEPESPVLPRCAEKSRVGVFAQDVGARVCAEQAAGRGFIDVGVGGCVLQGVECGGGEKRVQGEGGILWSARNTHLTKENCQLPESQISFVGIFQLPMVDSGGRSYPRMPARCLTHQGRDRVFGFLPHPHS